MSCIARELYLEGIPSVELEAELLCRAIARTDQSIASVELSLAQMRAKQIGRQKELARLKARVEARRAALNTEGTEGTKSKE